MTKIKTARTAEGEKFYYLGHTQAVVDDNGNNIEDLLAEQEEKIELLNDNTGVSDYPEFSTSKTYKTGTIVRHEGALFKFTSDHEPGIWDLEEVKSWSINAESQEKLTELRFETIPLRRNEHIQYAGETYEVFSYIVKKDDYIEVLLSGATNININCTYEDGEKSILIANAMEDVVYKIKVNKKVVSLGYTTTAAASFNITVRTGNAFILNKINKDYEDRLKWLATLSQIIVRTDTLKYGAAYFTHDFFLQKGMTINYSVQGLSSNIAIRTINEDGTKDILFASIGKGVVYTATLSKNIIALEYITNETQTITSTIECYNKESFLYKSVKNLQEDKVSKKLGKNLFNKNAITKGKFIWSYGLIEDREGYAISDYIPVDGDVIANISLPSGMGANVYDAQKNKLRTITTNQYTYIEGDAYLVYSMASKNVDLLQIERGTISTSYEEYTEYGDIIYKLYGDKVFETYSIKTAQQLIQNGAILRKNGMDIPKGSIGSGSMIQFDAAMPSPDCIADFYVITNIPASNFDASWSTISQESSNIVRFRLEPSRNTGRTFRAYIMVAGTVDASIDKYVRVSRLVVTPTTSEARRKCIDFYGMTPNERVFEVCKDFNEDTTGFGEYRFVSILDATDKAHDGRPLTERTTIKVMPGVYDEFSERFPVEDGEDSKYRGIITNDGTTYISFDPDLPELTKLVWDGHSGLSDDKYLNSSQAMSRAVFHINTKYNTGSYVEIEGFHIISSNCRYCIHPESSGYGYGRKWHIKNCILEWNGNAYVNGFTGRHLGIGLSSGEEGIVESVLFKGSVIAGIGGHNNGFVVSQTGSKPEMIRGASLKIINCNLNGNNISMNTFSYDATTFDTLEVVGCKGVGEASFGFEGSTQGDQNWRGVSVNSEIALNNLNSL